MQMQIYAGIDVGKFRHAASLLTPPRSSSSSPHDPPRIVRIPAIEQSRAGFLLLAKRLCDLLDGDTDADGASSLAGVAVLVEHTGHHHRALCEFLAEQGATVYEIAPLVPVAGRDKTDRADADALARLLYHQLHLGAEPESPRLRLRQLLPPTPVAVHLRGLTQHRRELVAAIGVRVNKIHAILDQVFPEFLTIFKDPSRQSALSVLMRAPSREEIAAATPEEITEGITNPPARARARRLPELATHSIGIRDPARTAALRLEMRMLARELGLLQEHLAEIDAAIERQLETSREGQILLSIPPIGPTRAAEILSAIGNIRNFRSPAKLKAYLGWAPRTRQSGTRPSKSTLDRAGRAGMRQTLYLAAWSAVRTDTEWRDIYQRLVERGCRYDAARGDYIGKNKFLGRIAGQLIELIWTLLWRDARALDQHARSSGAEKEGAERGQRHPPPPQLYSRELHAASRAAESAR